MFMLSQKQVRKKKYPNNQFMNFTQSVIITVGSVGAITQHMQKTMENGLSLMTVP